jgi:hypothetical protein
MIQPSLVTSPEGTCRKNHSNREAYFPFSYHCNYEHKKDIKPDIFLALYVMCVRVLILVLDINFNYIYTTKIILTY